MGLTESKLHDKRRNSSHHQQQQHAILYDARTNRVGVRVGDEKSSTSSKNNNNHLRLQYDSNHNHNQNGHNLNTVRLNPPFPRHGDAFLTSDQFKTYRQSDASWDDVGQVSERVKDEDNGDKKFVDNDVGIYDTLPAITCTQCNGVYCNYTCHLRCRPLVALDCTTQTNGGKLSDNTAVFHDGEAATFDPLLEEIVDVEEPEPPIKEPITTNDLRRQIDSFNANVVGSEMKLLDDGKSFAGFIRVHMKLCRPINVVATARPTSIYDVLFEEETTSEKTLTSFYLPRDTVKALHIASDTTTQEVIIALLNKFKVVDNPHKFALYERYYEVGESTKVRMRRIQDSEYPLQLVLMWNNQGTNGKQLVLQENDTGDIQWDSFSLPELSNFLRILQREEDEYLNQVRLKYSLMSDKFQEELLERKAMLASGDLSLTAPIPPPRRRHSETLISGGDSTMRMTSSTLPNLAFDNLPNERRQIRNVHSLRPGNVTSPGVVNGFGSKK